MPKVVTGIDISDRSFEIFQVTYENENTVDMMKMIHPVENGVITKGVIKKDDLFDINFNNFLDNAEREGFTFENVAVTIPEEFIKVFLVDVLEDFDPEKVEDIVINSLKDKLKSGIKDWNYEIYELPSAKTKRFLFLGIEKAVLFEYLLRISEFGLSITVAIPDGTALLEHIESPSEQGDVVVDFGENKTIIYFGVNGLIYKREMVNFGGESIINKLSKESNLSKEKEEKFFKQIGYSSKADTTQKRVIEEEFNRFFSKLEDFLKGIEKDYEIKKEDIYISGGLADLKGLKTLFPKKIGFRKLISKMDSTQDLLASSGAAVAYVMKDKEDFVDFYSSDIKEKVIQAVEKHLEEKEKNTIEDEVKKGGDNSKELEKLLEQNWGSVDTKGWKFILKFTFFAQLLFLLMAGTILLIFLELSAQDQNITFTIDENKANQSQIQREYINYNYQLGVVAEGGDITTDGASTLGEFQEVVVEVKDKFVPKNNGIVEASDLEDAKKVIEERLGKGEGAINLIKISDSEIVIDQAISMNIAFSAADKAIGAKTNIFTYTVKAKVKFAVVDKEKLEILNKQFLAINVRKSENPDDYSIKLGPVRLLKYEEDKKTANFIINLEAEK